MATTKIFPITIITTTDSYARIKNPRVLIVIRTLGTIIFAALLFAAFFAISDNYRAWEVSLTRAAEPTRAAMAQYGLTIPGLAAYLQLIDLAVTVSFCGVGLLIFWRRTDDWIANLMTVFLWSQGFTVIFSVAPATDSWQWLYTILVILVFVSIFALMCFFPNGKIYPRWFGWLFIPYLLDIALNIYNRVLTRPNSAVVGNVTYLLAVVFWSVGILAQIQRLRHTDNAIQRQQTKRIITGGTLAILGAGIATICTIFATPGIPGLINIVLLQPLFLYGGLLIFVIMASFSILRYRLWEIDLVVNRGLVYGGLTVGLATIFVIVVVVLQTLLQTIFGGGQTTLAAVVSVGVVVALFNPIRQRLQQIVDKRFFGLRHDLSQMAHEQRTDTAPITGPGTVSGKMLGPYQAAELLGRGGMGEVYKGYHPVLQRSVAIKVLSADLASQTEFRLRFEREARTLAGLHHPNIVSIFDFGETDGVYYMVMEHIEGRELSSLLRERHALPLDEAIPIINDIASALDYAHEQNLIHRDVKPSNIMLRSVSNRPQQAILMDFGLIKLANSSTRITQNGTIGTLAYMAPEQIMSSREIDYRADIYALGITTYQMLTGRLPFTSDSAAQIVFAHVQQPAPDPRILRPDLPEPVAEAILRSLAKSPDARPQSAGEFAAAIAAVETALV